MNPIPNTDLSVSPITLGTMTYGNPVAFDDAVDLTRYALAQGINMIDTANMYEGYDRVPGSAGGVAERIIGRAIQGLDRSGVLIATKLGMKVGDSPEDAGTSASAVHTQLSRSLERLGTDYVDLYYLHCPDPSVSLEETLRAIDEELRRGRIRYYGVSNYSAGQLAALLAAADQNGLPRPVACQPPLSLLKQEALEELLPLCRRENIAVIPYQIYQGGLLTGKYRRGEAMPAGSRGAEMPGWLMARDDALYDKLEEIQRQADARGMSMSHYALRWALEQPTVVSAIVGVKRREQIDSALAALA